jgi:hypothetical protein
MLKFTFIRQIAENRYQVCERLEQIYNLSDFQIKFSKEICIILPYDFKEIWHIIKKYRVDSAFCEIVISPNELGNLFSYQFKPDEINKFLINSCKNFIFYRDNLAYLVERDIYFWFKYNYKYDSKKVLQEFFSKSNLENLENPLSPSIIWKLFVMKNPGLCCKISWYYSAAKTRASL